ncbi:trypsin-like serine protease [Streptomyces sp. NPDC048420]|uniref:trypsin-like serine protease n=1 Tax=Streptomyces sp. NPDC048420 TaxID=3155755 RepID=UPI00342341DA
MAHHRPRTALTGALLVASVALGVTGLAPAAHAVVGDPAADGTYAFTARIDIGDGARRCSGALVDPYWVLTAASCFADDPSGSFQIRAGKPAQATRAVIGRTDTTATTGQSRTVVELAPRTDRDLVLARLNRPVTDITPAAVAAGMPVTGESLLSTGYGRTATEWAPLRMHQGDFSVDTVGVETLAVTGKGADAICAGDTGGPLFRTVNGSPQLAGVNSRSWQGGCYNSTETRTGALATRLDDIRDWVTTRVQAARIVDFNGDGVRDTAVADPQATVAGVKTAGLVRVVLGGGKGTQELSQNTAAVSGGVEEGDQFGSALATVDHNLDGYTDLVVATPAEDLDGAADAGVVQVIHGSADGLAKGPAEVRFQQGEGSGAIGASASEAGDRFGHALAASVTTAGDPVLVIGAPGEDLDGVADAGNSFYVRGSVNAAISQPKPGVPGDAETSDRYGTTVAASPTHIAIGTPFENIGDKGDAGTVQLFTHTINADGLPTPLRGIDQDVTGPDISGASETSDKLGAAVAMVPYRATASSATAPTDSVLAIGIPGEDFDTRADGGRVIVLRVTPAGTVTELPDLHQDVADVAGSTEAGDRFGEQVSAVAAAPGAVASATNTLIAVGIPGEDLGTAADAGSVYVFSPVGAPGANDRPVEPGRYGVPGAPVASANMGSSLHTTGTHLYIGMPKAGSFGSAYVVPWGNVLAAGTETVAVLAPGSDGLPAAGVAFGTVVR